MFINHENLLESLTYYWISSVCYLIVIVLIGMWSHSRHPERDPHLGGRSMGFWMTALSAHASDMSAWLFISLPMLVWSQGASQIWVAIGLWIGMGLNWLIVSKRLRIRTAKANCSTLPAWFHYAFSDRLGLVRWLCAGLSTLFLLHYLAAGLIAMGLLMQEIFGIPYDLGTAITVTLIAGYTMRGGFNAVAWVDLFQAVFLLAAIMIVPILAWIQMPLEVSIAKQAAGKFISLNPFTAGSSHDAYQAFFNALGWGLGYFGMPHILSKFMGIRSPLELRKSMAVGLVWQLLALGASVAVGVVALGFIQFEQINPQLLFIEMVKTLTHPAIAGLIFCAIMAANLSTMDSQLLVASSVVETDLFAKWLAGKSSKHRLFVFRLSVVALSLVAWAISMTRSSSVQSAVMYSWSGLGACYGPLVLWSLYAKPSHWLSACFALLGAGMTVMLWERYQSFITLQCLGEMYEIPALVPGFIVGFSFLVIAELVRRACRLYHLVLKTA